jgi:hypothetical protein
MNHIRTVINKIWDKIFLLSGVLFVLLPLSPLNLPLVYRDSGVFLYTGWRILNGQIPYLEIWDHKPPVIFFINALGLAVTNGSRWGVWIIEFIALCFAAMIGFKLIQKFFGSLSAVFGTFLWMLTLVFVIQGGNLTEEYTLPLQFAALWLFCGTVKLKSLRWKFFLIGLLGSIAFFTKQTSIGIWMAIVLFLFFQAVTSRQIKNLLSQLLFFSLGFISFGIPVGVYFGLKGAFSQFIDAAFKYNFVYVSTYPGINNRMSTLIAGIKPLSSTGLFQLAMIGSLIALVLLLFKKENLKNQSALLIIALIDLPLEILLIGVAGNLQSHYFITILPCLGVFTGLVFWVLISSLQSWGIKNRILAFFTVASIIMVLLGSTDNFNSQRWEYSKNNNAAVINYILDQTSPEERVLLWGAEASINFESQRISPTRFVYQYPLYEKGYTTETSILEFLDEVIRSHPKLIIDTKNYYTPMVQFPIQSQAIKDRVLILQTSYHLAENINGWDIYESNDPDHP